MILKSLCVAIIMALLTTIMQKKAKSGFIVALYVCIWVLIPVVLRVSGIHLLGISFLMLKAIAYMADIHYGRYEAGNLWGILLFFLFIPTYLMGPIMRYDDFRKSLKNFGVSHDDLSEGLLRAVFGLFKKLVIADRLMIAVRLWFSMDQSVIPALLIYSIALWGDFSGGCDIAIGISRCFGIKVNENFNRPYSARNLSEFWRRWHMTMASFFRDYVFIPLSISPFLRKLTKSNVKLMTGIATLVCFGLTGLWHGFTLGFLIWGLLNGIIIVFEGRRKPFKYGFIYTYFVVSMLRIFDLCSAEEAFGKLRFIASFSGAMLSGEIVRSILTGMIMLGVFFLTAYLQKKIRHKGLVAVVMLVLVAVFGVYGLDFDTDGFVYGKY